MATDHVVGTENALRAAQRMQSLLAGDVEQRIQAVAESLRTLSNAAVWDGSQAAEFRNTQAPRHQASLLTAIHSVRRLGSHAETVTRSILAAGSEGGAPTTGPVAQMSLVGAGAPNAGQGQGDPVSDADRMKQAIDGGDLATADALLDQLPSDSPYLARYFQELGPDETLRLASLVGGDPTRLHELDRGLAAATNSPYWDPSFNGAIWNSYSQATIPISPAALLLQDGAYSEDFLTRAGDKILLTPPYVLEDGPSRDNDAAARAAVLAALARNSDAAGDYLAGDRLATMLATNNAYANVYPEMATQLGNAIASGAKGQYSYAMLANLSRMDNQQIPDGSRFGIAGALASNITAFQNVPPSRDGSWSWQATLFNEAEVTGDGRVISANLDTVHAAIVHSMGMPPASSDTPAWQSWAQQYGDLNGLSSLPIKQAGYTQADQTAAIDNAFGNAFGFVPVPGGPIASFIANQAADAAFSAAYPGQTLSQAQSAAAQQYWTQVGQMRTDMATQFLVQNPGLAAGRPGSEAFMEQVQRIATETVSTNSDPAQIQQFVSYEDIADSSFQNQYWPPAPQ